eukprot:8907449-Pyramimonas_sp.AAC.1
MARRGHSAHRRRRVGEGRRARAPGPRRGHLLERSLSTTSAAPAERSPTRPGPVGRPRRRRREASG